MVSITIDIQDSQFQKLKALAESRGLSPEDLLKDSVEALTNKQKDEFENASEYVLKKNANLYRQLA